MQPFYQSFTALAVTALYVVWQRYTQAQARRARTLQERVTYLLWVVATQIN